MTQKFINNFATEVASTFGIADTFLQVKSVTGFPVLTNGDFILLTVYDLVGVEEFNHEVIKVTARNALQFTVERNVEGTGAKQFSANAKVEARDTAGSLNAKADKATVDAAIDALTITVAQKADGNAVTNALLLKADASSLATKADITYVDGKISGLVNAAPTALDTLKELSDALGADANFAATTATALGNRVRVDTAAQGLSGTQKTNAKTNLDLNNVDNTSDANKPVSAAQAAADALALPKAGGSMGGNITGADNKVIQMMLQDIGYTAVDKGNSGTNPVVFDFTAGCKQKVTATGAHTFSFTNWPPTGNEGILRVDFFNYGAFAITPPTVTWTNPDGSETTSLSTHFTALGNAGGRSGFTAAGNTKAIFWSSDAGATVYGKFI